MELFEKMQQLQAEHGYLPRQELAALARENGRSPAQLIGSASFYEFFRLVPEKPRDVTEDLYPCCFAGPLLSEKDVPLAALAKAEADPQGALEVIKSSGLSGRGGGGFPTGMKWETTANTPGDVKYVICNADEGEPGTGKDRVLLERSPEAVLEGMAICAAVIGSLHGVIYLRGEYADLKKRLEDTISALDLGAFAVRVQTGMGAYVCGEETALLASLEGERGEPRLKPPYPGVSGYNGAPTVINNAETFACVPGIILHGAELFRSRETKLYTVSGCVREPGVYECTYGITVGQLLAMAGGAAQELRAVLLGGGSGSLMKPDVLDMPMTKEACARRGAVFGTAAVRFIGVGEDLPSVVRQLTGFYAKEACGMCAPCRIGLRRVYEMLEKAERGLWPDEMAQLKELCGHIRSSARCGLGQAAVTPVLTLIEKFPEVLT